MILPHSDDIEKGILSACLFGAADEVVDILSPEDFYKTDHAKIYKSFTKNTVSGKVDIPGVIAELPKSAVMISKLLDYPSTTSVDHSCKKIKELAALRNMMAVCNSAMNKCANANGNAQEVIDKIQTEIFSVDTGTKQDNAQSLGGIMQESIDHWEEVMGRDNGISGVVSGFADIDRITAGFQPGEFSIIAARPGMGKTALAMNMAINAASKNIPVGFFSLEMSKLQLSNRIISAMSNIDSKRFRPCKFSPSEWEKIATSADRASMYPLYIDDGAALNYMEIRRRARGMVKNHDVKIIFVDFIQIAKGDKGVPREQEIGSISGGFKAMAKDLNIPVVALSQLNRKVDERNNKKPVLSDLRESGTLEQDTDIVMFIYRDDYYNENSKTPGVANIIFSKNRHGEVGEVDMRWVPVFTRFENLDRYRNPA